jgi:hypothetical protein
MNVNVDIRAYTGDNVLLPGNQAPCPATILISTKMGKIIAIHEERHVHADYPDIPVDCWIDTGDRYLLPGLIEYVGSLSPFSFSLVGVGLPTAPVVDPPPPARMYISMNPGVRTGRGFGRVRVQLRPGASPPSWTCRSTRYHQRLRLKISRRNVVRRSGSAGQTSRSGAASSPAIRCSTIRFFMPTSWSESAFWPRIN